MINNKPNDTNSGTYTTKLFVLALGLASFDAAACRYESHSRSVHTSGTEMQPTEASKSPNAPVLHHWIQHDELYLVMKRLGANTSANWPSTLPDDPEIAATAQEREQAFRDGSRLAAILADTAREIPQSVAAVPLSEADRTMFVANANLLSDQAGQLDRAARARNIESMQRQLADIRASCISCHTRFKDISGDLPPRV